MIVLISTSVVSEVGRVDIDVQLVVDAVDGTTELKRLLQGERDVKKKVGPIGLADVGVQANVCPWGDAPCHGREQLDAGKFVDDNIFDVL